MRTLCVIPARSGSKRLPDKAILPFAGTTLLEITCRQANRLFEDIVFSSDSQDYLDLAAECYVPYLRLRPPELATDDASSISVVRDALEWMEAQKGVRYDTIVLLQITSPLRLDEDIEIVLDNIAGYPLASACNRKFILDMGNNGFPRDRPQLNGAVFAYPRDSVFSFNGIHDVIAVAGNEKRSVDIDTEFDFKVAEFIYKEGLHK